MHFQLSHFSKCPVLSVECVPYLFICVNFDVCIASDFISGILTFVCSFCNSAFVLIVFIVLENPFIVCYLSVDIVLDVCWFDVLDLLRFEFVALMDNLQFDSQSTSVSESFSSCNSWFPELKDFNFFVNYIVTLLIRWSVCH